MDMSTAEVHDSSPVFIANSDYGVKLKVENFNNDKKTDLAEIINIMQCLSGKRQCIENTTLDIVIDLLQVLSRNVHVRK